MRRNQGERAHPAVVAAPGARLGTSATLEVVAVDGRDANAHATASAVVTVSEVEPTGAARGIPEPQTLSDPEGRWRSRMLGDRWEINEAHPDYVSLRAKAIIDTCCAHITVVMNRHGFRTVEADRPRADLGSR